jgi:hypothetical protein
MNIQKIFFKQLKSEIDKAYDYYVKPRKRLKELNNKFKLCKTPEKIDKFLHSKEYTEYDDLHKELLSHFGKIDDLKIITRIKFAEIYINNIIV